MPFRCFVIALALMTLAAGCACLAAEQLPEAAAYKDGTFEIEGVKVQLKNGKAVTGIAPNSATQTVTRYFGNEAAGDLDGDGVPGVAFLLTQTHGGSGTFYYVAATLKTANGIRGTNAILLGDRIAPQRTGIRDGVITVTYGIRKANEPMTAKPSVAVSRRFRIADGVLREIN